MNKFVPKITSLNVVSSRKKNSNGFEYEEVNYELIDSNNPNDSLTKLKTCIFFENNVGICIQVSAEASKFQSDLLDSCVDTAVFFKPQAKEDSPDEFATYINDRTGFEFTYPKGWQLQDGFAQGLPQVTLNKSGSQTFGVIIVEPIDSSLNFDFQKYITVSLQNINNMKQLTQGQCDINNLTNTTSSTSTGYTFEKINYELVNPNDSTIILSVMQQNIFFQNDFGYVVQTTGPATNFDDHFMDLVTDQIKFKTPK